MLPSVSVSVGVIGKALTCTLRLNLHMWARLRSQTGERHGGINHRRRFYPDGSHTSPVLLCLRIPPPPPPNPSVSPCLWYGGRGFWLRSRGRRGTEGLYWAGCVTLAQQLDNMLIKIGKKKVGFLQMWFIKLP